MGAWAWQDRSYSENALFLCESSLHSGMDRAKSEYSNDGARVCGGGGGSAKILSFMPSGRGFLCWDVVMK